MTIEFLSNTAGRIEAIWLYVLPSGSHEPARNMLWTLVAGEPTEADTYEWRDPARPVADESPKAELSIAWTELDAALNVSAPQFRSRALRATTYEFQAPVAENSGTAPEEPPSGTASSGTTRLERPRTIADQIERLFVTARSQEFEDGMETRFSRGMLAAIREHGSGAVEVMAYLIAYEKTTPEVASEALRWLGRCDDRETHRYRRWLLERSLTSASSVIRDGALIGLAALGDAHAVQPIRDAIEDEPVSELKREMAFVAELLGAQA